LSVNNGAHFIEELLMEGNADGSMTVKYPKQTAEAILVLSNAWLDTDVFKVSYKDYVEKLNFMDYLFKTLGLPIMDNELKKLFLKLHKDYK